ncbi:MAG: glycosyltransferase family 39 protein [Phycisphaerae bacterium]|nr:glycosyltransferase family 39 protein [Phycisphaerae bacterium]
MNAEGEGQKKQCCDKPIKAEISANRSNITILMMIVFLGLGVRLVGWNIIDTIYRDTVGYIECAAKWQQSHFLKSSYQEPLHILVIRTAHRLLFPHESVGVPLNPASWELAAVTADILFSLGSIMVLYGLGKRLHSPAAGLWAAFFLAIQPFGVIYAINGLTEPVYVFFMLTSLYFALTANPHCKFHFFLIGMWMFLSLLVRKDGIILPGVIGAYIFVLKEVKFIGKIKLFFSFLLGIVFVTGVFLLIGGQFNWLGYFVFAVDWNAIFQKTLFRSAGDTAMILATMRNPHWLEILYLPPAGWVKLAGYFPAIFFMMFLCKRGNFHFNRSALLFVFAFFFQLALVYAFTVKFDFFTTRYLYPATVVVFPVAGAVLAHLLGNLNAKMRQGNIIQVSVVAGGIIFITLVSTLMVSCFHLRRPEIQAAAQWLAVNTPTDSVVGVTDNRIGFYCRRAPHFISEYFYEDILRSMLSSTQLDRCYLAVYFDKKEPKEIHQRLMNVATLFKFEPVLVKSVDFPKKQVDLYKLRSLPPAAPATQSR